MMIYYIRYFRDYFDTSEGYNYSMLIENLDKFTIRVIDLSRIIYNIKVISAIAGELHIHCGQLLYPIYHLTSDKEAYINYMAWYRDNMVRINSVRYDTIAPKPTDNL